MPATPEAGGSGALAPFASRAQARDSAKVHSCARRTPAQAPSARHLGSIPTCGDAASTRCASGPIVDRLRAPDGCTWDQQSRRVLRMRPSLIEEGYERSSNRAQEADAGSIEEAGIC